MRFSGIFFRKVVFLLKKNIIMKCFKLCDIEFLISISCIVVDNLKKKDNQNNSQLVFCK